MALDTECCYTDCHLCRVSFILTVANTLMLSVVILCVVMLSVVMLKTLSTSLVLKKTVRQYLLKTLLTTLIYATLHICFLFTVIRKIS
jgi:hypothetical protein